MKKYKIFMFCYKEFILSMCEFHVLGIKVILACNEALKNGYQIPEQFPILREIYYTKSYEKNAGLRLEVEVLGTHELQFMLPINLEISEIKSEKVCKRHPAIVAILKTILHNLF